MPEVTDGLASATQQCWGPTARTTSNSFHTSKQITTRINTTSNIPTHTGQTCSKMLHRKNKLPQSFLNGTCGFDFQEKVTMTLFHIYFTTDVTIKAGLTAESSLVILFLSVLAVPTERIFRALRVAQSRNCKMGALGTCRSM